MSVINKLVALMAGMTRSLYRSRTAELIAAAQTDSAGLGRKRFLEAVSKFPKDGYALTLWLEDGKPVIIRGDGTVATRPSVVRDDDKKPTIESLRALEEWDLAKARSGWHPSLRVQALGSAPTAQVIEGQVFPSGAIALVGKAGAGKTPLGHALAGANDETYSLVAYGEPLAGYATDLTAASQALGVALMRGENIVFDSIKDLLSLASGGAMKSGLSRGVFPILTHLSVVACDAGVAMYIPINPSSPDKDVMELLSEAVASNTTGLLVAGDVAGSWQFMFRRGEGIERDTGSIVVGTNDDGEMVIKSISSGAKKSSPRPGAPTAGVTQPEVPLTGTVDSATWSMFQRLVRKAGFNQA